MVDRRSLSRTWRILAPDQRRTALALLGLMSLSALTSAGMVASVFPFLSALSDPGWIDGAPLVARLRAALGLTGDHAFVVALGWFSIGLIALGNLLLILREYATVRFSQMLIYSLSRELLARYLHQPYSFTLDRHSGDLATNVLAEAGQVVNSFIRPLLDCAAATLTLVAVLATVVSLEPVTGTAAFALVGGVYGALLWATRRSVRRYGQRRAAANEARFRISSEAFGGIKDVKLLGLEDAYVRRFAEPARELADAVSKLRITAETPRFAIQGVVFIAIILFSLALLRPETVGTEAALGGIVPVLGLLAFGAQRAMPELSRLYTAVTQMRFGAAAVERIWRDYAATAGAAQRPGARPAPLPLRRAIEIEDIAFRYPEAERGGLDSVSLTIGAGERIGIVGATGAGKTTLADILLGLLRPQQGRIRVDGREIDDATVPAWQRAVSYVPQDIFLTDASVAENIALGVPPGEIDRARVERCARRASLHDFVSGQLPRGYDTRTGERGVRLSGGQRQRIGIARALYHDAALIVLDEATSALDSLTEREVIEAIDGLPGEKTVVMIAHRLSTLRHCDRIVLLERGRVVATGSWEALMAESPAFRDFARHAGVERLEAAG